MPAFGRLAAPDHRDYPLRRFLPVVQPPPRPRPWPMFGRPLDQGSEGTCCGHGAKHWMLAAPVIQTTRTASPTAVEIYDRATELDEWPGNEHDRQAGTSVRATFKALQSFGVVTTYAFTTAVDEVTAWLSGHGSIVIGVNWYESMFDVDAEGYLRIAPGARVAGGHCVNLDWFDARRGTVDGPNSWGDAFGRPDPRTGRKNGRFKLPLENLDRLLREDGEAATATETRRSR